jgi:hypothetical protein
VKVTSMSPRPPSRYNTIFPGTPSRKGGEVSGSPPCPVEFLRVEGAATNP